MVAPEVVGAEVAVATVMAAGTVGPQVVAVGWRAAVAPAEDAAKDCLAETPAAERVAEAAAVGVANAELMPAGRSRTRKRFQTPSGVQTDSRHASVGSRSGSATALAYNGCRHHRPHRGHRSASWARFARFDSGLTSKGTVDTYSDTRAARSGRRAAGRGQSDAVGWPRRQRRQLLDSS